MTSATRSPCATPSAASRRAIVSTSSASRSCDVLAPSSGQTIAGLAPPPRRLASVSCAVALTRSLPWPTGYGAAPPPQRLRQVQPVRDRGRLSPAADVELAEDPRDVHARRLLSHEQRGADLAVGGPLREQR